MSVNVLWAVEYEDKILWNGSRFFGWSHSSTLFYRISTSQCAGRPLSSSYYSPVTSSFENAIAAPIDVILEEREPGKLTAAILKKSSSVTRKAALLSSTFTKQGGRIVKVDTPKSPPKDKQADHVLEAQTLAKAFHKAGYKTTESLGSRILKGVKDIFNHHTNLVFVDTKINQAKGRAHRAAHAGKPHQIHPDAKAYMKENEIHHLGTQSAKNVESYLKDNGIHNVAVKEERQGALKTLKIKRERSLDIN
ncbi:hypothetical protein M413DRAFT_23466 [Hebeloma cylindrosporum]|uniref:Uncharacterized protein n=1 Tax=Hebeloma cylindrosporum TaxID=76867 RepID=A0A0C3CT30_HEBCY|nr:hypothetical protein M413DRAFT_23466 [Hebeloma cylindrosporum h7]